MRFGTLRNIIQPLSRTLQCHTFVSSATNPLRIAPLEPVPQLLYGGSSLPKQLLTPWNQAFSHLHSLTDPRYPKRRPVDKPRRKRATLRPPGPYAWVQYVPGEPILPNRPNEGSIKRRNEKKRIKQRHAFIVAERKKRKAQMQEANRKKVNARVERKMAAVARDRAWAQRLAELQQLEEEKKSMSDT
ncbi:uncharacterized protein LOC115726400 [Rhodamnia argentea]|uniref:Uncharacterized protein LOC115726400 n=1 Tax=Rhodamnia argentea TaxID=178133 RepID=A0ABM3HZ42_9MYRT|nr:uncharacterized protein LOC115726400 [Rhodamnia argentea]